MWLILLDTSASMGEPLSGDADFLGRATVTGAATKLEAAVEAILERLRGRSPNEVVSIITFTSRAKRLVAGPAGDHERFRRALGDVEADDGTDISLALIEAAEYIEEEALNEFHTVLLVTDGKSDPEPALAAKPRLVANVVQVSAILIDPNDAAEDLLRALLHNGEIQAVMSGMDLRTQVGSIDAAQQSFAKEVQEVYSQLETYARSALAVRNDRDDLCFSVAHPKQLFPDRWVPLLLYIHTSSLSAYIGETLRTRAGELYLDPSYSQQAASTSVPRGTELTVTPVLPGLRTNPRELRLTWEEDVHELTIKIRADSELAGQRILGSIDISVNGVLIGDVPVSILVSDRTQAAHEPEPEVTRGQLYRRVFASYSRKDAAVVQACVNTYEALGIYVYLDKMDLRNRSGEAWKEALLRFIEEADVFQLYWSSNAEQSKNVEMEWRHALTCSGSKGQRFVRPLVWTEDFPNLPDPLAGIQLGFLKLDLWRAAGGDECAPRQRLTEETGPECVVLPAVPGSMTSSLHATRIDTGYAVRFLEETTGLRYYPVATLLVDEFIVRSVREKSTVDEPPGAGSPAVATALADFLQALALDLHVGFRDSLAAEQDRESIHEALGKGTLFAPRLFEEVLSACEWAVISVVREFPGVAAWELRRALGEASSGSSIPQLVRTLVDALAQEVQAGNVQTIGYTGHFLSQQEYYSVRPELERAGIEVSRSTFGANMFSVDVDSNLPFVALAENVADDIEAAVGDLNSTFSSPARPPLRSQVLSRLVRSGLETPWNDEYNAASTIVAAAMDPSWKQVADRLAEAGAGDRMSRDLHAAEMLGAFLSIVQELFRHGVRSLGNPQIDVGYTVPAKSWATCAGLIDVGGVETRQHYEGSGRETVRIKASLRRLATAFEDASESLLRVLPSLTRAPEGRSFTTTVPTFGIFTRAGNRSVDDRLSRWAREVGVSPEFTLPGTSRVLLCVNALDRLRELMHKGDQSAAHAHLFQRSVLVHEHFHAVAAEALDEDGRRPQGPRHSEAWQDAAPVNEALAAWMELHASRDQPEIHGYVEEHIGLGQYPAWPYAGALALEAVYASDGLSAVREWIRRLRNDPIACRARFDSLIDEYRTGPNNNYT